MNKNIVTIIPARGGSKGIPRKNIMDFCGKPLLAWTIEHALHAERVCSVYVSTDCPEIADVARGYGAQIIIRPEEISGDCSSSEDAVLHALGEIEKKKPVDLLVFLQATSPVRQAFDIDKAIDKFYEEKADSLFSASVLEDFTVWQKLDGEYKSVSFDHKKRGIRQERNPVILENGSFYMFTPQVLREYNNRIGGKLIIYPMPIWKAHEIDDVETWDLCEYYMRKKILAGMGIPDLSGIELIIYDFDGVMTDNSAIVDENCKESVSVNRSDGLAVELFKKHNIPQVIISTETNKVVAARAQKLGIPVIHGVENKLETVSRYCRENNYLPKNVLYTGNDLNDLEAMQYCGLAVAPADAQLEITDCANWVLKSPGGKGVVRELWREWEKQKKGRS